MDQCALWNFYTGDEMKANTSFFRGKEQGEICQGWLSNITCMVDFEKHRKKSVELMGVVVGMLACGFHMSFPFNSVDRKWQTSFSPMGTTMKSYWIYYCVPKKNGDDLSC